MQKFHTPSEPSLPSMHMAALKSCPWKLALERVELMEALSVGTGVGGGRDGGGNGGGGLGDGGDGFGGGGEGCGGYWIAGQPRPEAVPWSTKQ